MKIDIKENSGSKDINSCEFPEDHKFFGEASDQILRIYIKEKALKKVDEYLASDLNNELGGVLIGTECENGVGKKFIKIEGYIIAEHTNASISRLTFTHETWDRINEILERDFPGLKILGWFHSHPGHTVFLSNYDMFIQENFFNMDYMVAYVYDPTIHDRGFFSWNEGKTVKSSGYYVYECEPNASLFENDYSDLQSEISVAELNGESNNGRKILKAEHKNYVILALLFVTLILLLLMIYNYYDFRQKALLKEQYVKDLTEIRNENKRLSDLIDSYLLDKEINRKLSGSELKEQKLTEASKNPETETVETHESKIEDQKDKHKEIPVTKTEPAAKENSSEVTKYTVKPGDTFEKISNLFYKSRAGINLLMKHNNMKKVTDLKIGQVIEIPEFSE